VEIKSNHLFHSPKENGLISIRFNEYDSGDTIVKEFKMKDLVAKKEHEVEL